ncbi:MAG: hypothetical protein WDZ63_13290 [Burkholderiales bacterium]
MKALVQSGQIHFVIEQVSVFEEVGKQLAGEIDGENASRGTDRL